MLNDISTLKFTLFTTVLGWLIILYLNNRTLNRAEISRQIDQLQSLNNKLIDWLLDIYHAKVEIDIDPFEQFLEAKVNRIDFRATKLNDFVGKKLFDISWLVCISVDDSMTSEENAEVLLFKLYTLSDSLELAFQDYYKNLNWLTRLYLRNKPELEGITLGIFLLFILFVA
jgi:hypothetical protein